MPETTTTGVVAPAPETKSTKPRSAINQAHARELSKAETVTQAAKNEDRATALANRDIDEEYVTAAFTEVGTAREKAAEVVLKNTAQLASTATLATAEKALFAGLREVQKAAKQKHGRSNPIALADYFIGERLNGSKPNLAQTSQTIIEKLATDKLPGFTAAKVKAVEALRKAWVDAKDAQVAAESAASSVRSEFKTLLKGVSDKRVAIQLAADAEWPHTDEENHGVRKEFVLPVRQPVSV